MQVSTIFGGCCMLYIDSLLLHQQTSILLKYSDKSNTTWHIKTHSKLTSHIRKYVFASTNELASYIYSFYSAISIWGVYHLTYISISVMGFVLAKGSDREKWGYKAETFNTHLLPIQLTLFWVTFQLQLEFNSQEFNLFHFTSISCHSTFPDSRSPQSALH